MEADSLELARAAAGGDRAAVGKLLELHLPALRAFVRLRAGPTIRARESCSDLVQSTCREILTHLDGFEHASEQGFRLWLFTTAQRKIANRARFHRAQRRDAGREAAVEDVEQLVDAYRRFASPTQRIGLRDEMARIEKAFDALTDEQREVVTLAHLVGLSRREIAARLGKEEGTVRVMLHRSLARLAELLDTNDARGDA